MPLEKMPRKTLPNNCMTGVNYHCWIPTVFRLLIAHAILRNLNNLDPALYTLNIFDYLQICDFTLTTDKRGFFFMYDVLLWPIFELEDTDEENATGC